MAQIAKIINAALAGLNQRQNEVLKARFGLGSGNEEGETLAAIGDRLSVTRERVRQIENTGTALARANILKNPEATLVIQKIKGYVAGRGGVMKKSDVLLYAATLAKGVHANQIDFLAEVSGAFTPYTEDDDFVPFYYVGEKDLRTAKAFVGGWAQFLGDHKEKVFSGSYDIQLVSFMKTKSMDKSIVDNYLSIAKHVRENPYGDKGLRDWPEINPTTVRDKIYLVLKKKGEPLHFEDIARHINAVRFDDQKALAPTVHNELIKDDRFVLVGRGMYGLSEQGYEPGTAREVIAKVLKTQGPLTPAEVVTHVNKQRFFKPNTILINLQNKATFERLADGKYRVRQS